MKLKYSIWFLLFLLVVKVVYVFVESGYNYEVLTTATSKELSKDNLDSLNAKGHIIASFGFTIFSMPLLFFLSKKISQKYYIYFLTIITFIFFMAIYQFLNIFVNKVVEYNKDKRYEAYYTNLIKYGMVNEVLYYNSFIPKDRLNSLSVEDRILLINMFLLLEADKNLIKKFKEKGEIDALKLYIKKFNSGDYNNTYIKFKTLAKNINKEWLEFNNYRKKLKDNLEELKSDNSVKKAHSKLMQELDNSYDSYLKAYNSMTKLIIEKTSLKKLREIKTKLEKFYRYRGYKKAQNMYAQEMQNSFGHYIEPNRWLDSNQKATLLSISKVIREEIEKSIKKRVDNLPKGLSKKEFLNSFEVKSKVAKKLKQKGILIPKSFDYSYKSFKKYYKVMAYKKEQEAIDKFYKELKAKIGKNDLKLNYTWEDFVKSNFLYNRLKEKNISNIQAIQNVLISKDMSNFKKQIYEPQTLKIAIKEIVHGKEEFYQNKKVIEYGNEAIKLLYIPPLALTLSIVALMLNLVSVVVIVLSIFVNKLSLWFVRVLLFSLIIALPFYAQNNINSKIFKKSNLNIYKKIIIWSDYWIKLNYKLHKN